MRSLQSEIEQRGRQIFELVDNHPESLFSKAGFYQRLMALSMRDEQLKLQLFRFVDVLPSLGSSGEIRRASPGILRRFQWFAKDLEASGGRHSFGTHCSVDQRARPAMECFRNGAPVHRRTKSE